MTLLADSMSLYQSNTLLVATARSTLFAYILIPYCAILLHDIEMTFIYIRLDIQLLRVEFNSIALQKGRMRPDFVYKARDGCLVGRDIICCCMTTVEIRHAATRGPILHARRLHRIALSVPEEPASRAPRSNHVDKLAIPFHVGHGVFLKLGANRVEGVATSTFAFIYNRGVRHKRVGRIAGDKEVNIFSTAGPDFGTDRPR